MTDAPKPPSSKPRRAATRVDGRRFALAFAAFLLGSVALFTYFARRAQVEREAAFERMQEDHVPMPRLR